MERPARKRINVKAYQGYKGGSLEAEGLRGSGFALNRPQGILLKAGENHTLKPQADDLLSSLTLMTAEPWERLNTLVKQG